MFDHRKTKDGYMDDPTLDVGDSGDQPDIENTYYVVVLGDCKS